MTYTLALFISITSFIWFSINFIAYKSAKEESRLWLYVWHVNNIGLPIVFTISIFEIMGYYNKFISMFSIFIYWAIIGNFVLAYIIEICRFIKNGCKKPRVMLTNENIMAQV